MDTIHILILAIVQGLSEFLPISSSAHLILVPKLLGWQDQGLAFDVAVHVGTLIAVFYYFRVDLMKIFGDFFISLKKKESYGDSRMVWLAVIGTIPVGIVGLLFNNFIEETLRSPLIIAFSTIFFGFILWKADLSHGDKKIDKIGIKEALLIGIAQAIALIPGTSRSGITITAALFLGFSRTTAARFSFLLSIPVIVLAGALEGLKLVKADISVEWGTILLGIIFSAVSAYLCIFLFLRFIEKAGMLPFVIYRLILGIFLFFLFF